MAKWVDLPADSRLYIEFFKNEIMANHHVVDHIFIDWASFIMHRPPGIDQLKLTILHKASNFLSHLVSLLVPPHLEELHLNLHELSSRVSKQGIDDGGELYANHGSLEILRVAIEVLIDRLEPSDIVVRVRHDVDSLWLARRL